MKFYINAYDRHEKCIFKAFQKDPVLLPRGENLTTKHFTTIILPKYWIRKKKKRNGHGLIVKYGSGKTEVDLNMLHSCVR